MALKAEGNHRSCLTNVFLTTCFRGVYCDKSYYFSSFAGGSSKLQVLQEQLAALAEAYKRIGVGMELHS